MRHAGQCISQGCTGPLFEGKKRQNRNKRIEKKRKIIIGREEEQAKNRGKGAEREIIIYIFLVVRIPTSWSSLVCFCVVVGKTEYS